MKGDMERGLIFDCDGVLADTELHGHLVAFNQMWKKARCSLAVVARAIRGKAENRRRQRTDGELVSGARSFRQVFAVPEERGRTQSSHREMAQREDGHLPANHRVGGYPAAVGDQENRGSRSRRRLEVGGGINFRQTIGGSRANPCGGRIHRKTVHRACRRRRRSKKTRTGHLPAGEQKIGDRSRKLRRDRRLPKRSFVRPFRWYSGVGDNQLVHQGEDFSEARLVVSALGDPGGEKSHLNQNRTGHPVGEYVKLEDVAAVLAA